MERRSNGKVEGENIIIVTTKTVATTINIPKAQTITRLVTLEEVSSKGTKDSSTSCNLN